MGCSSFRLAELYYYRFFGLKICWGWKRGRPRIFLFKDVSPYFQMLIQRSADGTDCVAVVAVVVTAVVIAQALRPEADIASAEGVGGDGVAGVA